MLKPVMELYLVRHTTPDIAPGICYGQSDIGVKHTFEDEVAALRPKIAHIEEASFHSSPLQRCLLLAQAVAGGRHEIQQDARLKELNFGDWELQSWDDIPRGLLDEWADEHVKLAPPNGESFHQLSLRVQAFVEQLTQQGAGVHVAFTHAGVIRALTGFALGLPLSNVFRLHIDYASVTKLIIDLDRDRPLMRVGFVNR